MTLDRIRRAEILRERADGYLDLALRCITREYPNMPWLIAEGPGPYPTHREAHPIFFGCFDWHSCVEMHWAIVRLLRRLPELDGAAARATMRDLIIPESAELELAFFRQNGGFERPYGWGWFLTLYHELATWGDADGRAWTETLAPLADHLVERFLAWLPKLTYPQRVGVHQNTAFGLSRAYDEAARRAGAGDSRLLSAIHAAAGRWFGDDTDYPARYEPSGADFLSAALCEAELMSRILRPEEFSAWFDRFLPAVAQGAPAELFAPAVVSDPTDGQIAHLHGLNLSRAWAFIALADRLPATDPRIPPMLEAAARHADASLPHVAGSHYMVEHWLAAYAVLLLSE